MGLSNDEPRSGGFVGRFLRHPLLGNVVTAIVTAIVTAVAAYLVGRADAPKIRTETKTIIAPPSEEGPTGERSTPAPTPTETCAESKPYPARSGYEPNDRLDEATGPMMADQAYAAEIETENDEDYFVFCAPQSSRLIIRGRLLDCRGVYDCSNLFVVLRTEEEEQLGDEIALYTRGDAESIRYTATKAGRYYLVITGDESNLYDVRVTSNEVLVNEAP